METLFYEQIRKKVWKICDSEFDNDIDCLLCGRIPDEVADTGASGASYLKTLCHFARAGLAAHQLHILPRQL